MTILQRLRAAIRPDPLADPILARYADPSLSAEEVQALADRARQVLDLRPDHFGLAFAAASLAEMVAGDQPWERREAWFLQAVGGYERALDLAESGQLAGLEAIADATPEAWPPGLHAPERARLAATFRLGLLLAGEFRVRDPVYAAELLARVVARRPTDHLAWYYLGEARLLANDFDAAERAWREGLAHSPENPTLIGVLKNLPADRVRHRAKAEDWPAVLAELQRLPDDAMPAAERLTIQGDAHRSLGDLSAAKAAYQAALAADRHALGVRRRLREIERV